jgi:hypothetical protein
MTTKAAAISSNVMSHKRLNVFLIKFSLFFFPVYTNSFLRLAPINEVVFIDRYWHSKQTGNRDSMHSRDRLGRYQRPPLYGPWLPPTQPNLLQHNHHVPAVDHACHVAFYCGSCQAPMCGTCLSVVCVACNETACGRCLPAGMSHCKRCSAAFFINARARM